MSPDYYLRRAFAARGRAAMFSDDAIMRAELENIAREWFQIAVTIESLERRQDTSIERPPARLAVNALITVPNRAATRRDRVTR